MTAFPTWKIKRELKRLREQVAAIAEYPLSRWKTKRYDQGRSKTVKSVQGDLALSASMSIVLLYQPNGISASVFRMLDWLKSQDITPLIISNAPISENDSVRLKPYAWKIVQRPNFGYDFGGYREGMFQLWEANAKLETLYVLNDSVWFPLDPNTDFLPKLAALNTDISGTVQRRKKQVTWLESYFYRISGTTFHHPEFRKYWTSYLLTSNKFVVIRRGERDFSTQMLKIGFSLGAVYEREDFITKLRTASFETLRRTLQYANYTDSKWTTENESLMSAPHDDDTWRDAARRHIESSLSKAQFHLQFGYASEKLHRFPFLKKSNDQVNTGWRTNYFNAVENGDTPRPDPEIWQEITQSNLHKKPT